MIEPMTVPIETVDQPVARVSFALELCDLITRLLVSSDAPARPLATVNQLQQDILAFRDTLTNE